MGGEREDVIESKPAKSKAKAQDIGNIRFHENNGEVHFHDDANNLKVAIPVAEWWQAWRRLRQNANQTLPFTWTYHDVSRKTLLTIQSGLNTFTFTSPYTVECNVQISTVEHGPVFDKLEKFTPKGK